MRLHNASEINSVMGVCMVILVTVWHALSMGGRVKLGGKLI